MAMTLQPSRLRITQAVYFGHPPGFGVTSISGGNGITPTPNPIITVGSLNLSALTADWTAWAGTAAGPHFDILARNVGRIFNVKAYGALGDSVTDDITAIQAAVTAAKAVKGVVYFPRSAGFYRVSSSILVQDATGISLVGEGTVGSQIAATVGSPGIIVLDVIGTGGSGSCRDVVIKDLGITSGAAGTALRIQDVLHFTMENVYTAGGSPCLSIQASGNGTMVNVQAYGGVNMGNGGGALTNVGPIDAHGCQFVSGALATALVITGDTLAIVFTACQFQNNGGVYAATTTIDGGASVVGSVDFVDCHGESNYNGTNTAVDFLIGNVSKFGHVGFYGGNYWGHGDVTNYQASWLKVVRCADVVAEGVVVSKLGNTNGYNTAMVRLEATFPGAGDTYRFSNLKKTDINGVLYSDANGVIATTYAGAISTPKQFSGGTTSAAEVIRATSKATIGPIIRLDNEDATSNLSALAFSSRSVDKWELIADPAGSGSQSFSVIDIANSVTALRILGDVSGGFIGLGNNGTPTRTLDLIGTQRWRGIAAPAVSEANSGTIYFDSSTNKLMASLNGGAYVPIIGSGGLTGSGTANRLAYWDATTDLAAPTSIYMDAPNNRIGINVPTPTDSLSINGNLAFSAFANQITFAGSGRLAMDNTGRTALGITNLGGANSTSVGNASATSASGANNTSVGSQSLLGTTTGTDNTAVGLAAGGTNTIGTRNIFIGSGADATTNNLDRAGAIGYGATIGVSNGLNIGGGFTKVGISTNSPQAGFDVNASVAMRHLDVTLINGLNSNIVPIANLSFLRITGPSGGFSIGGFSYGAPGNVAGLMVYVFNSTTQQMTIVNEDASSTATSRIKTLTGGNVVLRAGTSAATFMYCDVEDRFILMSSN